MAEIMDTIRDLRAQGKRSSRFWQRRIWDLDLRSLPLWQSLGIRFLRVGYLVVKGFRDDECSMHASALTFSSLMSIVPILALMLSMARGLGDADTAKNWVQDRVRSWTETFQVGQDSSGALVEPTEVPLSTNGIVDAGSVAMEMDWESQAALAERINAMVEQGFERVDQINFARLGTVGLVVLIWMVIEVLGRVERSFNRVWGVVRGRSVWRRFTDYISVLLILPILIAAAASVPVVEVLTRYMPDQSAAYVLHFVESGFFRNMVVVGMTTLVFSFVIMFMPNTTMRVGSGLTGGFVAAVLFLLWLWLCAMVQVGAARYGKIYGSFALVPIVLAWVHVSWQIVLFGAEVAFSVENAATYRMERSASDASIAARLTLAVLILREAGLALHGDGTRFSIGRFVDEQRVPVRFVHAVVEDLVDAGYLVAVADQPEVYVLLRAADQLSLRDVLHGFLHAGADTTVLGLGQHVMDPVVRAAVDRALGGAEDELAGVSLATLLPGREQKG